MARNMAPIAGLEGAPVGTGRPFRRPDSTAYPLLPWSGDRAMPGITAGSGSRLRICYQRARYWAELRRILPSLNRNAATGRTRLRVLLRR